MRPTNFLLVAAVFAMMECRLPAAFAADPDVDAIVDALRPTPRDLKAPTRGIGAAAPQESDTHPAAVGTPRATAINTPNDAPSTDLTVEFTSGSAELTPAAERTLRQLGEALERSELLAYRFRIEGHTDTIGTEESNQALSQARAEKVAAFLESDFGVAAARLKTVGMGKHGLLVETPDNTDEPRNRRVHIVNLGT